MKANEDALPAAARNDSEPIEWLTAAEAARHLKVSRERFCFGSGKAKEEATSCPVRSDTFGDFSVQTWILRCWGIRVVLETEI